MQNNKGKHFFGRGRLKGAILLALALLVLLGACGSGEKKKYKVVVTIFPLYDWSRQVLGDDADTELILLQDAGVDLHNYQPTAADMANIASCDLFIYVGGESDEWTEEALKNQSNKDRRELNLMELLGDRLLEEEHKEGMEEQEEHEHEGAEEEEEMDEHIWLSLKNAGICAEAIRDVFKQMNSGRAKEYDANAAAFAARLSALEKEYEAAAAGAVTRTLLVGDRFPFRYLTEELGLDYYAAFAGCSAETEASFDTVIFLAKKLDELGLKVVLQTENGDSRLAQTIIDSSEGKNRRIVQMDSLQAVTRQRIQDGATYLGIMEKNLEALKEALK